MVLRLVLLLTFVAVANLEQVQAASEAAAGSLLMSRLERQVRYSASPAAAVEPLEAVLQKDPGNSLAHLLLAIAFERCGYLEFANREYERAARLNPTSSSSLLSVFDSKWKNRGKAEALEFAASVAEANPQDPAVLLIRALAAYRQSNLDSAEKYYREALDKYSGIPGIASTCGEFSFSQGRYDEALELADHDLTLEKTNEKALLLKGRVLLARRMYLAALPLIQRVYEKATDLPDRVQAAQLLASLYLQRGMTKLALEPAFEVVALLGEGREVEREQACRIVEVLIKETDEPAIKQSLQNVQMQLQEQDADKQCEIQLLATLSRLFIRNHKYELAEELLNQELKLAPGSCLVRYDLACLYEAKGEYEQARDAFQIITQKSRFRESDPAVSAAGTGRDGHPADRCSSIRNLAGANYSRLELRLQNESRDLAWKIKSAGKKLWGRAQL